MAYNYVFQKFDKERMARSVGLNLPISRKKAIEVAAFIKGKPIPRVKRELKQIIEKKMPVPYKRFYKSIPHRRGDLTTGRYPVKTISEIKKVVYSAVKNAEEKGFDEKDLIIIHASAQKSSTMWHYGRMRGRKRKVAHFEVAVESKTGKKSTPQSKKPETKETKEKPETTPKNEIQKETKKETPKPKKETKEKPISESKTQKEKSKQKSPKQKDRGQK